MFGLPLGKFGAGSLRELQNLQRDINRAFSGISSYPAVQQFPALNVWESSQDIIFTAELPGIDPDNLDISVVNDTLTLRGTREPIKMANGEIYHRQERTTGRFSRTISLPFVADAAKVNAAYKKGILTITVPRAEKEKPKKISIKSE
jgi:HSP20 family protein